MTCNEQSGLIHLHFFPCIFDFVETPCLRELKELCDSRASAAQNGLAAAGRVCVCETSGRDVKLLTAAFHGLNMLFVSMKGAAGNVIVLQPTKTAMTSVISIWDAGSTYLLSFFPCQFLKWRPAKPRTGISI